MHLLLFLLLIPPAVSNGYIVNHLQGQVNVEIHQTVQAGTPMRTGAASYLEFLLNPGSILRLNENTEVTVDSIGPDGTSIRLTSGTALIEAGALDDRTITITTGELKVAITEPGLYRVDAGAVSIIKGKILVDGESVPTKDRLQVVRSASKNQKVKLPKSSPGAFDRWSRGRAEALAKANTLVYRAYQGTVPNLGNIWIYNEPLGGYTYLPLVLYKAPYGQTYYSVQHLYDYYRRERESREAIRGVEPAKPAIPDEPFT